MKRFVTGLLLLACASGGVPVVLSSRGPHPSSNPDATIVVEEYADLQCPSCRTAHAKIVEQLLERYGAVVRFEFRHFPLTSVHPHALAAAQAAECAADQGKFWEYLELAFTRQREMSGEALSRWARELALDGSRFEGCLASEAKRPLVVAELKEGRAKGVLGTPTFFVNGKRVESALRAIERAVEADRASTKAP